MKGSLMGWVDVTRTTAREPSCFTLNRRSSRKRGLSRPKRSKVAPEASCTLSSFRLSEESSATGRSATKG